MHRPLFQWLRRWMQSSRHAPHRRTGRQLRFDTLEDRTLLSTLTVLNLADSGADSLRERIGAAVAGDTINFAPGLSGTIVLSGVQLVVNKDLTIQGPGAKNLTVSAGGGA